MKLITVKQCYNSCPFFGVEYHEMYCAHPHWKNRPFADSMIITIDNSKGRVPDLCPLRDDILIETTVYELDGWKEAKEQKETKQ
jgi:hypothetical protein